MGILTGRTRRALGPGSPRARGPLLWSLLLHAAAIVGLSRFAPRAPRPAEVLFAVQVASAPSEAVDAPIPDLPPEDVPPDDVVVEEPAWVPDAPPDEPPPAPDAAEPEVPDAPPPSSFEPLGPRSATTRTRAATPAPPTDARPGARPDARPVATPPPPPRLVAAAAPASPASAGASAVEGARPDATNRPPVYPAEARANRWTGVVTVRLEVDAEGIVRGVAVASSSGYAVLDRAAVDAAWGWHFTPARRGEERLASSVLRRIRFVLDGV